MAEYLADHQIRVSQRSKTTVRLYNPLLVDISVPFGDETIFLRAQEIVELPFDRALIAKNFLLDQLMNRETNHNTAPGILRKQWEKEVVV